MTKLYVPKTGSRISKKQAQFIGEIAERNAGQESRRVAEAVVDASKDPRAPTHSLFRGTNAEKARKWDVHRALILLGMVVEYRVERSDAEPRREVRAFTHLPATHDEPSMCVNTASAVMDENLRERIYDEVNRRLTSARMFAAGIKELVEVIDEALAKTTRMKKAAGKKGRAA